MRDIHSHLLPGIDDGSKSFEESIKLISFLSEFGVTDLILTPHYVYDSDYNCNNKKKKELFDELCKRVDEKGIDINLYLGNEIYFSDNLLELLQSDEIYPLNNSKYLLIEFPMTFMPKEAKNVFEELMDNGYTIILAHPERYNFLEIDEIKEFMDMGILLQGNYMSLFDKYGKRAKKVLKKLLKKGWISFLASDIHHGLGDITMDELIKKVKKYAGEEKTKQILKTNVNRILRDE